MCIDKLMVVVAHPDDEVLGAGGTLLNLKWTQDTKTGVVTLASRAAARYGKDTEERLLEEQKKALDLLEVDYRKNFNYPDAELATTSHLDLVRSIEEAIVEFQPQVVITHWPGDLHEDHKVVSRACQEAVRYGQRHGNLPVVKGLWFMEVPSSTDWSPWGIDRPFRPVLYMILSHEEVAKKVLAMNYYSEAIRSEPHPRARLKSLAEIRGSQAGCTYAEAFEIAYQTI